jgi:hypothetical protein
MWSSSRVQKMRQIGYEPRRDSSQPTSFEMQSGLAQSSSLVFTGSVRVFVWSTSVSLFPGADEMERETDLPASSTKTEANIKIR